MCEMPLLQGGVEESKVGGVRDDLRQGESGMTKKFDCCEAHSCKDCGGCLWFPCKITANGVHPCDQKETK